MVELPIDIINHINSFVMKDKEMKSPVVDIIDLWVKWYQELKRDDLTFKKFMDDPRYHLWVDGRVIERVWISDTAYISTTRYY